MPYIPPDGNALVFDFTSGGYVAPAGAALVFEFVSGAIADNVLQLGAQWSVDAAPLPTSRLLTQWSVDSNRSEGGAFESSWSVVAPTELALPLLAQWAVEVQPSAVSLLAAQHVGAVPASGVQLLDASCAVDVGEGISRLAATFEIRAPAQLDTVLDAQWSTSGVPTAMGLLDAQWEIEGTPAHTGRLDAQWTSLGVTEVESSLTIRWGVIAPMEATSWLAASWYELHYVDQQCIFAYNEGVGADVDLDARIGLDLVAGDFVIDSPGLSSVAAACVLSSALGDVEQSVGIDAAILDTVAQACEISAPLLTTVSEAVGIDSAIFDVDPVAQSVAILSPILAASQLFVATQPSLTIRGQSVPLESVAVSIDEGEVCWTCEAALLDPRHYALFRAEDQFTISLGGEAFAFVVDAKRMSRASVAGAEASIIGISPAARWQNPRAKRITKTWSTSTPASAVVAEVLPGESIDWRIIDWAIPAFRLAADKLAPMEIAQRIVAAAGALIETNPDGSLLVRYAFPRPVADYAADAQDQTYSDVADRFSVTEGFGLIEIVNRIRVLDVAPGAYADVIEFEADRLNPSSGSLRVYPSPWRESFDVRHTSLPIVSVQRIGIGTVEHTETVEVLRGEGAVRYPIHQVLDVEWLYEDLGGVAFAADQRQFRSTSETKFESLLRITYRTRFIDHRAVAYDGAEVQFVVMEP